MRHTQLRSCLSLPKSNGHLEVLNNFNPYVSIFFHADSADDSADHADHAADNAADHAADHAADSADSADHADHAALAADHAADSADSADHAADSTDHDALAADLADLAADNAAERFFSVGYFTHFRAAFIASYGRLSVGNIFSKL
jgi:hypothetical protein